MRVCSVCSAEFDGKSPARYCQVCAVMRRRQTRTESAARKRRASGAIHLGVSSIECADCGNHFVVHNASQKCCQSCAASRDRELTKARNARYIEKLPGPKKKNPEVAKRAQAKYLAANPGMAAERSRRYNEANRSAINEKSRLVSKTPERRAWRRSWEAGKRASDPKFSIDARMSTALKHAVAGKKAGRAWESIVGYTLSDLMLHLEAQFLPGMTWDNRGEWHIDHRTPKASFTYSDDADPQFKACWALSNLRPLWAFDNHSKGSKSESEYAEYLARAA